MSSGRRRGHYNMTLEALQASTIIAAPAEAVFAVLADPASHPVIDGTGWVSKALDAAPLTGSGQMFRMAMYHANHPNGSYEMTNRVAVFDPPRAISWEPGKTSQATGSRSSADGPGATIWSPPTLPALRSRSPTTGPRSRRSYASTSRSRRFPWTTSPTRCATWPSWLTGRSQWRFGTQSQSILAIAALRWRDRYRH